MPGRVSVTAAWLGLLVGVQAAYGAITRWKNRMFARLLLEVTRELEGAGVSFWLDRGTLMGAWRAGKLLRHDTDTDLAIPEEHAGRVRALVGRPEFQARFRTRDRGCSVVVGLPVQRAFHTLRDEIVLHLEFVRERPEEGLLLVANGTVSLPLSLVRPLGRLRLEGREYPAPGRSGDYLTALYGYSGAVCLYEGGGRYRPCRSFADRILFWWNALVFYRVYFLVKALPLPRAWKGALGAVAGRVYHRLLKEPKT